MQDVARVAGVSRGTVSRYVRKDGYVSQDAAEAISAAIITTKFVPNMVARTLAGFPTRNVALIIHEDTSLFAKDPNLTGMMIGANRKLQEADYQLLVIIENEDDGVHRLERTLGSGLLDGVMVAAPRTEDPLVEAVRTSGLPAALVGQDAQYGDLPGVDVDNLHGAEVATQCLLESEANFPAHIAGPRDTYAALTRAAGFQATLGERFIENLVIHGPDWSFQSGVDCMRTLLEREPRIDSLFASSDAMAAGAIEELRRWGREVPADVRVVGFDDSSWATSTTPPLTTISQPAEALGERMAELVIRQLLGENLSGVVLLEPTELIRRHSA